MPSWAYQNALGPAVGVVEGRAADGHRALPDRHGGAAAARVAHPQPRASSGAGRAGPRGRPPAAGSAPAAGRRRTARPSWPARRSCGSRASSSRKNSRSPCDQRDAGVAAGRDAEVLRQPVGRGRRRAARPGCQPLPTTTTSSSTPVWPSSEASAALEVGRPVAHGEHHDADRGRSSSRVRPAARAHRSRAEAEHGGEVPDDGDDRRDDQARPAAPGWPRRRRPGRPARRPAPAATARRSGRRGGRARSGPPDGPGGSSPPLGTRTLLGVAHLRHPGVVPGHVHEVVLHLVERDEQPEQQARR